MMQQSLPQTEEQKAPLHVSSVLKLRAPFNKALPFTVYVVLNFHFQIVSGSACSKNWFLLASSKVYAADVHLYKATTFRAGLIGMSTYTK